MYTNPGDRNDNLVSRIQGVVVMIGRSRSHYIEPDQVTADSLNSISAIDNNLSYNQIIGLKPDQNRSKRVPKYVKTE